MEKLIIVGTGPNARLALSFVKSHNLYEVIGFAVNEKYKTCEQFEGYKVYELENIDSSLGSKENYSVFISLLWNHLNRDRRHLYEYCKNEGFHIANLISPLAILRSPVTGDNCWIFDYAVVQNDTVLGSNLVIMAGVLIGSDCNVESHCFLGAHSIIAGGCKVGEQTFVGLNATVFDDTIIGKKCIIGACTSVKRNMPNYSRCIAQATDIVVKQYDETIIEDKLVFCQNVR